MSTWFAALLAVAAITATYFLCVRPMLRGGGHWATLGKSVQGTELDRQIVEFREEMASPGTGTSARGLSPHLPQPDMLFIDEPAPGVDQLTVDPARAVVIVFGAEGCVLPLIAGAQLVRCSDPALAWRYAMTTSTGLIGPGYAVVDAAGQLRYLTHDVAPGERPERIQILVNALDGST
jgi:hypothetical protein